MSEDNRSFVVAIIGGLVCVLIPPIGVVLMVVVGFLLISSFFVDQDK